VAALALATLSVAFTAGSAGAAGLPQSPGVGASLSPSTVAAADPVLSPSHIVPLPLFQAGSARVRAKPYVPGPPLPVPIDTSGVLGPAGTTVIAARP
jgi:hypothetical protein